MTRFKGGLMSAIAVAITAAFGAGCGGGDDALSKSEYIARSGAICDSTSQRADMQFKRIVGVGGPPPPGQEQRYIANAQRFLTEAAIPIIRSNIDQRRELPAPAGDEARIAAIIAAGERALRGFEEIASDRAKVRALFEGTLADPARQFDALSRSYGIARCGGDGDDGNEAQAAARPLTKPQYLRRAAEICRRDDPVIDRKAREFFAGYSRRNPPPPAREAQFVDEVVIPTHQQQLDDLRALPIPQGDADQVEPFFDAAEAFLAELRGDPSLYIEQRVTPTLEQASQAAARYGLRGCTP
jgi:hypothetical protein